MRYLSGVPYAPIMRWEHGGVMFTPEMGNRLDLRDVTWAADNGCYTAGDKFSPDRWLAFLERWRGQGHCLFAVLPDVPFNHDATLVRSLPYVDAVRQFGYPVALAIQNGATLASIPWQSIDAVFIAGDVAFKTSQTARRIALHAKARGLHVHIARRNSGKAVQGAYDMQADTVDGTYLAFGPDKNWPRVQRWFAQLCPHAQLIHWGGDPRFGHCPTCGHDVWRTVAA